jgi:hypothetical protein
LPLDLGGRADFTGGTMGVNFSRRRVKIPFIHHFIININIIIFILWNKMFAALFWHF